MKIAIIGAGLTGLSYALLLKHKGHHIEIYEKRPESDIDNLDSIIYIKKNTLDLLKSALGEEKLARLYSKGIQGKQNDKIFVLNDHLTIEISTLQKLLIEAATEAGIPIYRQHKLVTFSRNKLSPLLKTKAVFLGNNNDLIIKPFDQLLLACSNHGLKALLGKEYKHPVELHYTNLAVARMPFNSNELDPAKTSSVAIHLEYNTIKMLLAQLAAHTIGTTHLSVGNFSLYLASLNRLSLMSSYAPEMADELRQNPDSQAEFLRARLRNARLSFATSNPEMDFSWLEKYENGINEKNVVSVTAFAAVLLPEAKLYQQGVIPVGDAFVTTPFIFGSEYNEHMVGAFPIIQHYLDQLDVAHAHENESTILHDFIESLWKFILDKNGTGLLLSLPDMVGNTVDINQNRVNLTRSIGFPISREKLEAMRDSIQENVIPIPTYQQGGYLAAKQGGQVFTRHSTPSYNAGVTSMGLFAAASAAVAAAAVTAAVAYRYSS